MKTKVSKLLYDNYIDPIDEIVNEFDFEKVHKVMKFLNWTWETCDGVPGQVRLANTARRLLNEVKNCPENGYARLSRGGFIAERHECGNLELTFYVDNWGTIDE